MIAVRRGKSPAVLTTKGKVERADAIAHYKAGASRPFDKFKVYGDETVRDALNKLFHFKCAYCESLYGATQPVDVEHYRPKGGYIACAGPSRSHKTAHRDHPKRGIPITQNGASRSPKTGIAIT